MTDAKEYLSRPGRIRQILDDALQKVAYLKSLTEKVSMCYGPESIQIKKSRDTSAMEDAILRLTEARNEEARLQEEYAAAVLETGLTIDQVQDAVLRRFLEKRYLEFMTVEAAAFSILKEKYAPYQSREGTLETTDDWSLPEEERFRQSSELKNVNILPGPAGTDADGNL